MESIKDNTVMQYAAPSGGKDTLTGLLDINQFFIQAEKRRDQLVSEGQMPVMIFLDFNGMKNFNNRYGFVEGDKLILEMSKVLKKYFKEEYCCRIGGDRFVVISMEDGLENKLFMIIEESRTINRGRTLPLRVGVYSGRIGIVGTGLACDRAKTACDTLRNTVESGIAYFSEELLKAAETKQYIIDNLDRAISEKWIKAYFQPLIRSSNGRVCDEEALARWIDPVKGFMSPGEFIPVLEEARLIYKVDLYILDQILWKMKNQMKNQEKDGVYLVPCSINISRSDFETCDIVKEIKKRVDKSGLPRNLITIEITESTVGENIEYIAKQVEELQKLGFSVWMDDYGSGYSSPLILQKMRFNTVKLDMEFLKEFEKSENSKIILSSLIKLMLSLGMETVCEGVETAEQAEFLKEIGCTKLQGYHFCKPISIEQLQERYKNGEQIGFENPAETEYYSAIGSVNLYDPYLSVNEEDRVSDYFDTLPMAIVQIDESDLNIIRSNKTFREFFETYVTSSKQNRAIDGSKEGTMFDSNFISDVLKCANDGQQIIMDMKTGNGKRVHILLKRVSVNPVNNAKAVALIILGIFEENLLEDSLTFAHVAQALSSDYLSLYYVDVKKETFTEYTPDAKQGNLLARRKGENFFEECRKDANEFIYEGDRNSFFDVFTKENVLGTIKEHGAFTLTYRLLIDDNPTYVNMKALDIGDGKHIIIGVNNINAQMHQQEAWEKLREEKVASSRLMALSDNFIAFYSVNPATDDYIIYDASAEYESINLDRFGKDFFGASLKESGRVIWPDDLDMFRKAFTKDSVMKEISEKGKFSLMYRIKVGDKAKYVCLKAACIKEDNEDVLIVGLSDVDDQVKREREYAESLSEARNRANIDELTGVKNKHAYIDMEHMLNNQLEEGSSSEFAIVVMDLNSLKQINDTKGHAVGDEYIKAGCRMICESFAHSPVFRIGGDEFVAFAMGEDYDNIDSIMADFTKKNFENRDKGEVVVAAGMEKYVGYKFVEDMFRKADKDMYANKAALRK